MHPFTLPELEKKANLLRQDIIHMLLSSQSGHPAGALGMADIFAALYFSGIVKHRSLEPNWPDRDRIVLSNGHICPVQYAVLAHAGYFPKKELLTFRKFGSRLQGHPEKFKLPGVETTSGPLGEGLSQSAGIAYGARLDSKNYHVFCICSDAEHQEGSHWEAVMFAAKYHLANLTCIIDRNLIQISGFTEEVMPLEPLDTKYSSFNWRVLHINGHHMEEIINSLNFAKTSFDKPTCIIAHTIPGKGVSFMENDPSWHGKSPTPSQAQKALKELKSISI